MNFEDTCITRKNMPIEMTYFLPKKKPTNKEGVHT